MIVMVIHVQYVLVCDDSYSHSDLYVNVNQSIFNLVDIRQSKILNNNDLHETYNDLFIHVILYCTN